MEYHDYYKTLGLSKGASDVDIKKQYRRLARKYHPDVSKESNAEQRFKEVAEAYEVLKDPEKRRSYDQLGANWKAGENFRPPPGSRGGMGGGFGGARAGGNAQFSDFFESIFGEEMGGGGGPGTRGAGFAGAQQNGGDQKMRISIRLQESFEGGNRTISVPELEPNGEISSERRKLEIRIPKGIQEGQKIRLTQQGQMGRNGKRGNLLLEVRFQKDEIFSVDGGNILITLPITPWEAALGGTITVPTLGKAVGVKIAAGAKSGQKMRLKGRGLPSKTAGDQIIALQIETPPAESDEIKALYKQLEDKSDFNPRSYFENIS